MYALSSQLHTSTSTQEERPRRPSRLSGKWVRVKGREHTDVRESYAANEVGLIVWGLKNPFDLSPRSTYEISPLLRRLDAEKVFGEKVAKWLEETRWLSSLSKITSHPHFSEIVAMGEIALKLILLRMKAGEVHIHWFPVLKDIAGIDPVPSDQRGRTAEMARSWVAWGEASGKI